MNEWCDKESYLYLVFSVGADCFFTKNRYSWISHANLAIWWWRSSKVSSRSVFVFACHVIILNNNYSWIFLCYFSNNKKNLLMIYSLYLQHLLDFIKLKHCDVADWNRFWFSLYFLKYQFSHLENITFLEGMVKLLLSYVITKF